MSIAFFDVDGTLLPHPSLEKRFFWHLVSRGKIPPANYLHWTAEMVRLSVTSFATAAQLNKMYLREVSADVLSEKGSQQNRHLIPKFFPAAIQRVWWHALRGDAIVLVTGTLAPLAEIVKSALQRELLWRGVEARILVVATRLAASNGRWTGSVDGVPMFGEAKAAAIKQFTIGRGVSLSHCFAYGDHILDGSMLAAVGNPIAVNPTARLRRIAQHNGWPVMNWTLCPQRIPSPPHPLKWKGEVAR
jgi:HAD superfamily hydrolase (TIGR01490 family)